MPVGFNPQIDSAALVSAYLGIVGVGNGSVPGIVLTISPDRNPDFSRIIHTTPEQDRKIQDYINAREADPGAYNLFGRNCAQFVHAALAAGGIESSGSPFPVHLADSLRPVGPDLPDKIVH